MSKAGARFSSNSSTLQGQIVLRTILPNEYARAYVCAGSVFSAMRATRISFDNLQHHDVPAVSTSPCVGLWPIISARPRFYGAQQMPSVDCPDASHSTPDSSHSTPFCDTGDVITVPILGKDPFSQNIYRVFQISHNRKGHLQVRGTVVNTWTVHHSKRRHSSF